MKTAEIFSVVRRNWWIPLVTVVIGLGLAALVTVLTVPIYQSTVKFYVTAPANKQQTALQADELARLRIVGYAELLKSERIVGQVAKASGTNEPANEVASKISAFGDPKTLLLTVNVSDADSDRSLGLAKAIAVNFGRMVNELEGAREVGSSSTVLNTVAGPTLNQNPVVPRETLNLGLGLLVGAAVGVAILVARVRADTSIRGVEQLEYQTQLPLLATFPFANRTSKSGKLIERDPAIFEAALTLRSSLQFRPEAQNLKTIAITSTVRGDSKTTIAVHLASAMAEGGQRVLLVQADLRTPSRLAADVGLPSSPGLADVLAGRAAIGSAIRQMGNPVVDVITEGGEWDTRTDDVVRLLGNAQMEQFLTDVRRSYDAVIIEAAPVLPFVDARIICALSDGVILVSEYGITTETGVRAGLESLQVVHANVLGTVLSQMPGRHRRNGKQTSNRVSDRSPRMSEPQDLLVRTREHTGRR